MAYDGGSGLAKPPPPRYVMLTEEYGSDTLTRRPSRHRRDGTSGRGDGGGCCGCLCWCCCFLLLFVAAAAATGAYFVYVFRPKAQSYSVSDMSVAQFDASSSDLTVYTKLVASVRAENPNDMIGIDYGTGSRTVVAYRGSTLCTAHLPVFYQGYRNMTVMRIAMGGGGGGGHGFGSGLQGTLEESEKAGNVPLDVYVSVPVTLRLGTFDLREVTVNVHCALVVDSLSPKKKPVIKSAQYKLNVEF